MAAGLSGATLLSLGIILGTSFIAGELFERIGLESIFGYILTGLVLETIVANLEAATFLFLLSTISKLTIGYIIPKLHDMEHPLAIAVSLTSLDIETLVVLLIAIDLGILTEQILQIFAPSVLFSTLTIVILYTIMDRTK